MAINDLISSIILNDEFSETFNKYNARLEGSDKVSNKFATSLAKVGTGLTIAAGAAVGTLAAIDALTQGAVESQTAMFNVAASAQAAASEFGASVGSVDSWTNSIEETSDKLRVFGDRDVANATSRLIDMSKRLGLTEEQMKTVLERTGDVSAGKTDLADGVERVTAALRGEAEAAEFLSLSLNETEVRRYAESLGLVFKELTDGEKAQLRYELFLQQTDALQGRAAQSANTLAGAEAELERLRQREIDQIGGALIPLRQGEIALWQRLATTSLSAGDVIARVMAAVQTSMVVTGLAIKGAVDAFSALGIVGKAAFDAIRSGESPVEAIKAAAAATRDLRGTLTGLATDFSGTITETYNQLLEGNQQAIEAQVDLGGEFQNTGQAAQSAYSAAGEAAQEFLDKQAEVKEQQASIVDRFNNRIAQAEFTHQQRLVRLNEAAQQAIATATEQAAQARIASGQKLAEGMAAIETDLASDLSSIESDLASDRKKIIEDFHRDIDKLNQDRANAQRDAGQDLADLERDTQQAIDDINQDLADALADKAAKTEAAKLKIIASYGDRVVALEKSIADRRRAIDDKFSSEFEGADAFKRKILEYNRAEELKQLEQAGADEKTALATQRDEALAELEARAAEEAAILEREAEQKKARLERETQDRKDAIAQQLANDLEAYEQRQAELQRALEAELQAKAEAAEREKAAKQAAAEEDRAALAQKHADELVKINKQEQKKIEQAGAAIEREKQNHADKLAALRNAHATELTEIKAKLAEVEQVEADSQEERLNRTRAFSAEMQRLNGLAAYYQGGGGSDSPSTTTIGSNPGDASTGIAGGTVVVNQYGTGEGYAGAQQTGRTVLDALENKA